MSARGIRREGEVRHPIDCAEDDNRANEHLDDAGQQKHLNTVSKQLPSDKAADGAAQRVGRGDKRLPLNHVAASDLRMCIIHLSGGQKFIGGHLKYCLDSLYEHSISGRRYRIIEQQRTEEKILSTKTT